MELFKSITTVQIVLAISQAILIYAMLVVYFRIKNKNKEILQLKEKLNTASSNYSIIHKSLERAQQRIGDQVHEFTEASNIMLRKNLYLTYLLKTINQEWYKYLKVYNPEQSMPSLKLSTKYEEKEYPHYSVTDYKGKVGYAFKTDFVIYTEQGERRLSKLISQLEVPVPENGVLPLLTELKAKYVK